MSLAFVGEASCSINAEKITIHIQKIINLRTVGDSLRLRIRLISSDVKIQPGMTLRGKNYDLIALFNLEPIKKSSAIKDIIKETAMMNKIDRKQLILILEQEYNNQQYKPIHWKYINNNTLNLSYAQKQKIVCRSLKKSDLYQRLSTPTKILYRKQCQVCLERNKHKGGCNHLCTQCEQTLQQCPICRLQIMKFDRKTIIQILRELKRNHKSITKQNPEDSFKSQFQYGIKNNKNLSYLRKCMGNSQLCAICCVNPKNYVNMNCKHMCSCYQCGSKVSVCPICRTKMKGVKVFL